MQIAGRWPRRARSGGHGQALLPLLALLFVGPCPGDASAMRDLGQPVNTVTCWVKGLVPRPAGVRGADLWATTYNPAGAQALRYDPDTGQMRSWDLAGTTEIWDLLRAPAGDVYMGGRGPMLYRVNHETDELETFGPSPTTSFVRAIAAGVDGCIYGGGLDSDIVWRFDPASRQFESLGTLGSGVTYVAAICGAPTGRVYFGLGMGARLVSLDPVSGERRQILPTEHFGDSFVYGLDVGGGFVYATLWPSGAILVYDTSSDRLMRQITATEKQPAFTIVRVGPDGRAWLSQAGVSDLTVYDPNRDTLCPRHRNSLPPPYANAAMTSGGFITQRDHTGRIIRQVQANLRSATESIFAMGLGPDGRIYSDGFQILHLFQTDPKTRQTLDLGPLDTHASGETYSYAADGRYLYIAKYTHGGVYRYDPTLPYRPERDAPDANPKLLCELGMPVYRPAYNCWGPDGSLWFAGSAGWGWAGSGVARVDTKTGQFKATHLPEHGVSGIAPLPPECVAVATGGALLLWNAATGERETTIEMPASRVATDADGLLWIAVGERLQAYRWEGSLAEVGAWTCTEGSVRELRTGPDGIIYGLAGGTLIALPRGGGPARKLADCPAGASHLTPVKEGRFYFSQGATLYELRV